MKYEARDDAGWITFDRPEAMNSLPVDELQRFVDLLGQAEDERAAVISGDEGVFSAGGDLSELVEIDGHDDAERFASALVDAIHAVEQLDVPVIAAVEGPCYGAGFELLVACDLAVAGEDAEFGLPETDIGVFAPHTVERVQGLAGRKRTTELAMLGGPIDADTAQDWGIVNSVVDDGDAKEAAEEYLDEISSLDRRALRTTKRRIRARLESPGEQEVTERSMAYHLTTEESRRRVEEAYER